MEIFSERDSKIMLSVMVLILGLAFWVYITKGNSYSPASFRAPEYNQSKTKENLAESQTNASRSAVLQKPAVTLETKVVKKETKPVSIPVAKKPQNIASGSFVKNSLNEKMTHLAQNAMVFGGSLAQISPYPVSRYIEITDGCGPYYDTNPCVNVRSGPGVEFPVVARLRTGVVLKVEKNTVGSGEGWYKIIQDSSIRYPERIKGDWYVAANRDSVFVFDNIGDEELSAGSVSTLDLQSSSKSIVVDLSKERLYAYDADRLFMEEPISSGLELTPTPVGTFLVYRKTPSRYMQGPIPEISDQYYDLPGVPWNLYFTSGGAVIHGAYWHDHFGDPWSHGCVNLSPQSAKKLYLWAEVGTIVKVIK